MSLTLPPKPRWVTILGVTVDRYSVQTIERVDFSDGGLDQKDLNVYARLHLAFGRDQDIPCSPTYEEFHTIGSVPLTAAQREALARFVDRRYDEVVRAITGEPEPAHNRLHEFRALGVEYPT